MSTHVAIANIIFQVKFTVKLKRKKKMSEIKFDPKSRYYNAGNIETLDIIKAKLTPEQYKGYLLGNALKYQCRMNFKSVSEVGKTRDIEKACNYIQWLRDASMESNSVIKQEPHSNTAEITDAIDIIKANMQADNDLAWTWHTNIATACFEYIENIKYEKANRIASKIMKKLFNFDVINHAQIIESAQEISSKDKITMDFGTALEALKNNKKIKRKSWADYIHVMFMTEEQYRNSDSDDIKVGSIVIITNNGVAVNWYASHADMLAEDWIIVD